MTFRTNESPFFMTGKTKTKKTETKDPVTPYEPTPYERAAMVAYVARKKEKPLAPRMKVSIKGDVATISPDHPEAGTGHLLLMEASGVRITVAEQIVSMSYANYFWL
jgi:hypothetical protein